MLTVHCLVVNIGRIWAGLGDGDGLSVMMKILIENSYLSCPSNMQKSRILGLLRFIL